MASESSATSSEVAQVMQNPALIVARNVEWGTVIFGFDQANKYTIMNEAGDTVALMAEELGGMGRQIGRQLLRTHRPFTATVFSPDGSQVLFRVRRPFYWISSSIIVEDGGGQVVGEVHQRWHLWKRNYDLYVDKRQFATINGSFLAWEFVLQNQDGGVMALIDRNFQGFAKEIFTDAGKYVIHFGESSQEAAENVANTVQAAHPDKPRPPVTALARMRTDVAVIPTQTGNQLVVATPLGLSERMMALAAAISVDYDYFSRHSQGAGGGMLPFLMPMPIPSVPYPDPEADAEGGAEGAAADSSQGEASPGDGTAAPGTDPYDNEPRFPEADRQDNDGSFGGDGIPDEPLERDLGGDGFEGEFGDAGGGEEAASGFGDILRDFFSDD
ncbi:hypothetical protein WJX73_005262 [Symbiochloris irregularis]|uniref:Phospholipid scramblase n=1 Tax=Symbiochloris irregularis TaxID=706552 RepID=A0AAW1PKU4_9CHLO